VKLDLNAPQGVRYNDDELDFPVLSWVKKLAQIHARPPRTEWALLLTLHGEITWNVEVSRAIQELLTENCNREPEFATACRQLFGDETYLRITQNQDVDLKSLTRQKQQQVLMAFVPKKISQLVYQQGWLIETTRNLRYGGRRGAAPMVSWIMRLRWDSRVSRRPDALYRDSLKEVLRRTGAIAEDGTIS
jgi:hypothetical protein